MEQTTIQLPYFYHLDTSTDSITNEIFGKIESHSHIQIARIRNAETNNTEYEVTSEQYSGFNPEHFTSKCKNLFDPECASTHETFQEQFERAKEFAAGE